MRAGFFLCSLLLASGLLLAQKNIVQEKIDPRFLRILDSTLQTPSPAKKNCQAGSEPAQKQKAAAKYACLVYTKNAAALREKGITVNSVLPNFVTAFVTLNEIKIMSRMDSVTYIEYPANDRPQR